MDSIPSRSVPVVTRALILINVVVFFFELALPQEALEQVFYLFGIVPARFEHPDSAARVGFPVSDYWPLLTHQFLHGGWLHIIGNMWTLWIFGDNVEDRMGPLRFAIFYLTCSLAAAVTHLMTQPESTVPTVGASDAIAGVLGAYLLLFPTARLVVLFPLLFLPFFFELPAVLYLWGLVSHSVVQRDDGVGQSHARRRHRILGARWGLYGRAAFVPIVLCGGAALRGCNLMSAASSGRGSHGVESLKECFHGHFLVVFHARGASAGDHTTVAGGVAEATNRSH